MSNWVYTGMMKKIDQIIIECLVNSVAEKAVNFLKPVNFGFGQTVLKFLRTVFLTSFALNHSWSIK